MFEGIWRLSEVPRLALPSINARLSNDMTAEKRDGAVFAETNSLLLFGELRLDHESKLCAGAPVERSRSSGNLLLGAYERFGDSAFDLVEGEFALAIWNKLKRHLVLVRDALGRRPLFFAISPGLLAFGSDSAQLARRCASSSADYAEIADFLLQRRPVGCSSFFSGVRRVEPGTAVYFHSHDHHVARRWWRPDLSPTTLGDGELIEALEEQLEHSVAIILARTPTVAAHLSAGLDSSLAVATISRQLPQGKRLYAICASPSQTGTWPAGAGMTDEFPVARQTAAMLGNIDLQRIVAGGEDDWIATSDRFAAAAGMPYRNPGNLGWLAASYAAARQVGATTLIEANQGNVTYSWIGMGAVPALLRQGRLIEIAQLIRAVRASGSTGLMTIPWAMFGLLPPWIADPLAAVMRVPDAETAAFLRHEHPAVRRARRGIRRSGQWMRMSRPVRNSGERLQQLHWAESGAHNMAVERMFGIELSDPFASKRLVELTLRIDEPRFIDGGFGRKFARALLKNRVPDTVSSGQTIWQQGIDWRVRALQTRDAVLTDLDFASNHGDLRALLNISRLSQAVHGWSKGKEDLRSLVEGGSVLRAIAAIRFVRWAAEQRAGLQA